MTQAYEKESFFTFFLFKICLHELSLIFYPDCKELMRFINDLLVCFFFLLFQVSSFRCCLLHQYLSLLPRLLTSLYVCLDVCLPISLFLSISLYLAISLTSDIYIYIYIFFFLSLSISVYNSVFLFYPL